MKIAGFEKLSLQDYPNHISCIIFTQGCNLKCPFCQNSGLIPINQESVINETKIIQYLKLRKNMLNGVTISGGEPTLQVDLKDFIIKIKNLGFDVKLDTNGTNFALLKDLVENELIDYIAMDIKNSLNKYDKTSGVKTIKIENILNSISLLKKCSIDYEFRTTIINEYHTLQDILDIIKLIGNSKYYLQNFKNSDNVLDKTLTSFSEKKLILWNEVLKKYKNVYIRGITKEE